MAEQDQMQPVEQTEYVKGRTVLSINKPTPMWATWIFRVVFVMTGIAVFVISSEPTLTNEIKVRAGIYLKAFDMLIWGMTRLIGVDVSRDFNVPT